MTGEGEYEPENPPENPRALLSGRGGDGLPELSVVVPARDEVQNVGPLVEEIERVLGAAGIGFELIVVDDGSRDGTDQRLMELMDGRPWLRGLRRTQSQGQSAALAAGVAVVRGRFVGMLDADLQNDPADLPTMLALLHESGADFVQGDRSCHRRDSFLRRWASGVGRLARRVILGDAVRDTGCTARLLRADLARRLPLQFRGMHRFLPVYAQRLGAEVVECPVVHRPRTAGRTKYGVGVFSRGLTGLIDCFAVAWMGRRVRDVSAEEISTSNNSVSREGES